MVCSTAVVFPRDNPFSGMLRSSERFPLLPQARKGRRVLFLFTRNRIFQTWNLSKTSTLQKCVTHLQQFFFHSFASNINDLGYNWEIFDYKWAY